MDRLYFPEFVVEKSKSRPSIEVSIDFLPAPYRGKWIDEVRKSTDRYISIGNYKRRSTIWMYGAISGNFIHQNEVPSWSEFLLPIGFPSSFVSHLSADLQSVFGSQVRMSDYVTFDEDDGWCAICHVEQGHVWVQEDGDEWVWWNEGMK